MQMNGMKVLKMYLKMHWKLWKNEIISYRTNADLGRCCRCCCRCWWTLLVLLCMLRWLRSLRLLRWLRSLRLLRWLRVLRALGNPSLFGSVKFEVKDRLDFRKCSSFDRMEDRCDCIDCIDCIDFMERTEPAVEGRLVRWLFLPIWQQPTTTSKCSWERKQKQH